MPRAASEIHGQGRFQLLSVNEADGKSQSLPSSAGSTPQPMELTDTAIRELELLTY